MINFNVKESADKQLIKDIIKAKLGIDTPSETLLNYNVDEIEQTIKNYCNLDYVPKELTYTFVNMVCDLNTYDSQVVQDNTPFEDGNEGISISPSGVNSVRVGNTTISFGSGSDTSTRNRALRSHQANLDQLILDYKSQLNKFRKMVW